MTDHKSILVGADYPFDPRTLFLAVAALLLLAFKVTAQDLDSDNDGIPNSYEKGMGNASISDVFMMSPTGNSARAIGADEIQLTQDDYYLSGSAMSHGKIDLLYDFEFSVQAYFGTYNEVDEHYNSGADGIAMVFHNDPLGAGAIGESGEGIGAQGIRNGLVLEIDTYGNGAFRDNDPERGDNDDHTDIWRSDDEGRTSLIGGYIHYNNQGDTDVEDGTYHEVTFSWVASTGTLSFTIDGLNAGTVSAGNATYFVNTYFGGDHMVHFGFTAATGGHRNEHRVRIEDIESLPLVLDTDNDGIYDYLDLDSDNDGIYDAEEAGHGASHTRGVVDGGDTGGDGIPDAVQANPGDGLVNYSWLDTDSDGFPNTLDIDSDDDDCFDTIEAEYTDGDMDGVLGRGVPAVDEWGLVLGITNSYYKPTSAYIDSLVSLCGLRTDLGDEGDGDDAYVIFFEDSEPIDLMENPTVSIVGEGAYRSLEMHVLDLLDGNDEILIIGGTTFPLQTQQVTPVVIQLNGEEVRITYEKETFLVQAVEDTSMLGTTLEALLDEMAYIHLDTIAPTFGERILSVVIHDEANRSPSNTVTIRVEPVNDLPTADNDEAILDEGTSVRIDVADGDEDLDGNLDLTSILIQSNPRSGRVEIVEDGIINYVHDGSDTSTDNFTYTIADNEGGVSNEATVSLSINVIINNNAPEATDDFNVINKGGSLNIGAEGGVLSNDSDPDGDDLVVSGFNILGINYLPGETINLAAGTFTLFTDGSYTFLPEVDFVGILPAVVYTIYDGELTDEGMLTIEVEEVNQAPIANDGLMELNNLDTINGDLVPLVMEPDGDEVSFSIVSFPLSGFLEVEPSGGFQYAPTPGFSGEVSFTYQVCDDRSSPLCDQAIYTIVIPEMDTDNDGINDGDEDLNEDGDLSNDDCDGDGLADYLDPDHCTEHSIETSLIITNNADGLNDGLVIQGIEAFPNNRVVIFNRWGNKVWEIRGYDNQKVTNCFSGYCNQGSNSRLPDGTYYYVIDKGDNTLPIKGFLELKK